MIHNRQTTSRVSYSISICQDNKKSLKKENPINQNTICGGCNVGRGYFSLVPVFNNCYSEVRYFVITQQASYLPSVESTIVPSKSNSSPSKEWTCGGAEKLSSIALFISLAVVSGGVAVTATSEISPIIAIATIKRLAKISQQEHIG